MTHRGPFQPLTFCDSVYVHKTASGLIFYCTSKTFDYDLNVITLKYSSVTLVSSDNQQYLFPPSLTIQSG